MKAARLYENERALRIEEAEEPRIENGDALIGVASTGLCGTDLKIVRGFLKPPSYPHIMGHEIAGRLVDAKPSNAREEALLTEIRKAPTLLVHFYVTCGSCRYCLTNRANLCTSLHRLGFDLAGGFAEYVKAPIQNLVPTSLGPEAAVLTDAGATVWHAFKKLDLKPGTRAVVMGAGGLGGFAIQLSKLMGVEVIALDIADEKLGFAKEQGAEVAVNISGKDVGKVREEIGFEARNSRADAFVDLVGTEESQNYATALLRPAGRLLQLGYSSAHYTNVAAKDVVYNEMQIIGSLASTVTDLREITKLVESGKVRLNVTRKYRLLDVNSALDDLGRNKILGRVVITP